MQNTVQSFKRNIKYKVNQLLDTTSLSSLDNNPLVYNPNYNPNRKGLAKSIVAFPALSPLGSVLSSIITSLSVTSLAFTRELVFGASIKAGEDGWNSSPLINFRAPFVSAIYAVCEVLSTGIRYVLQIEGGGCGLGGDAQKYGKKISHEKGFGIPHIMRTDVCYPEKTEITNIHFRCVFWSRMYGYYK